MNKEYYEAFDKFASHFGADGCELKIEQTLDVLKTVKGLKPERREELLNDLSGWIRHYRINTFNFK